MTHRKPHRPRPAVFGVWFFMLPLLGAGVAGIGMGPMVPFITLMRHWIYALVLAMLYPVTQGGARGQARESA